jgi:drug/metabolite transporter (DMT)-like permease
MESERLLGTTLGLTSGFLWAVSTLLWKSSVVQFGARVMNFFKCSVSSAYLWVTALCLFGTSLFDGITGHAVMVLTVSGILGLAIGDAFLFVALRMLGAQPAAVLLQTSPLWSAALGMLFFGELLSLWQYLAIPLVCTGVMMVVRSRIGGGGPQDGRRHVFLGSLAGLIAALFNAVGALLTKQVVADVGALRSTLIRLTAAALFLALMAVVQRNLGRFVAPLIHWRARRRELLAVFLGTFLGVMCWQGALIHIEASVAVCLSSTTPLFLLPMAILILEERYRRTAYWGTLLAGLGIPILVLMGT